MNILPTPISILESHFNRELTLKDLSSWKEVSMDEWVGFAKAYLAEIKSAFTPEAMAMRFREEKIRLYFDLGFGEAYDKEITRHYHKTPLLGLSPYPAENVDYSGDGMGRVLGPLRKHLLVADELYLEDNFYRCFDSVADSYDRHRWRHDPVAAERVPASVAAILRWLPILAGLRELVNPGILNFLPYFVVPAWANIYRDPFMHENIALLDTPSDPCFESLGDREATLYGWIRARLLGLDPVFADVDTWHWASRIKFKGQIGAPLTSDIMSIDILPIGENETLTVEKIVSMRSGEQVFRHIRDTLIGCKEYVRENFTETTSSQAVSKICREYVQDQLNPKHRLKIIKFLDRNLLAGMALSVAVGAALMPYPLAGVFLPALITPKAILELDAKLNPKVRAAVRLETIL
jgi:hypothetical protein